MASAKSLQRLCRQTLPLMLQQANGQKMMAAVRDVVQTDRWNSFDRFGETTATLTSRYEAAGARVEVESIQTGGRIGSGRWIIREAADVVGATVDVVHPITKRVLDWQENPWHVIQWSAATPADGVRLRLVILDQVEDVQRQPTDGLAGAIVLTKLDPRSNLGLLAAKGATAVIADRPVPNLPNAVAWTKFGWGAIPLAHATARLVGFVISEQQGKRLRRLAQQRGPLTLHVRADIRKYVGSHDVVSGIIEGAGDPQDEVWAIAHSGEPGAIDNASGVATTLEIARVIEGLIQAGKLARPKRTIRLLNAYECYGFFAYLERVRRLQTPLAGVCIDSVGSRPAVCDGRLEWHATIPMSAGFVDRVGEAVLRAGVRQRKPGYRVHLERFMATSDTLIGDPQYGFPCPWITTHHNRSRRGFDAYHSSADVEALLSPRGLETCAASMAAYLYYLADMGSREVKELIRTETQHFLSVLQKEKAAPSRGRVRARGTQPQRAAAGALALGRPPARDLGGHGRKRAAGGGRRSRDRTTGQASATHSPSAAGATAHGCALTDRREHASRSQQAHLGRKAIAVGAFLGRRTPEFRRNRRAYRLRGSRLSGWAADGRFCRRRSGLQVLRSTRRIELCRVDRPGQYDRPQGIGEGFAPLGRHSGHGSNGPQLPLGHRLCRGRCRDCRRCAFAGGRQAGNPAGTFVQSPRGESLQPADHAHHQWRDSRRAVAAHRGRAQHASHPRGGSDWTAGQRLLPRTPRSWDLGPR